MLQSFQACYTQYTANKEKISRWNDANEYLMTSFNTVYGDIVQNADQLCNSDIREVGHGMNGVPTFEVPEPPFFGTPEPGTRVSSDRLDVNGRPLASPLPIFSLPEIRDRGLPSDRQSLTVPRMSQSRTPSVADGHLEDRDSFTMPRGRSVESQIASEYPNPALMSYSSNPLGIATRPGQGNGSRPVTPQPRKGRSTMASRKVSTPTSKKPTTPASKKVVLRHAHALTQ